MAEEPASSTVWAPPSALYCKQLFYCPLFDYFAENNHVLMLHYDSKTYEDTTQWDSSEVLFGAVIKNDLEQLKELLAGNASNINLLSSEVSMTTLPSVLFC